jgi:hypothetical protein
MLKAYLKQIADVSIKGFLLFIMSDGCRQNQAGSKAGGHKIGTKNIL